MVIQKYENPQTVDPLSNIDIQNKLKKYDINIKFVPYKSLKNINSLEDILPCILLYQLHFPIGHWVALFKNDEGINYFDPLGYVPDKLLKSNFSHPEGRESMNADYTYLNQLLLEYIDDNKLNGVVYSNDKLQGSKTNTCGYWCATRLLCGHITNDDFNDEFMKMKQSEREKKIIKLYRKL